MYFSHRISSNYQFLNTSSFLQTSRVHVSLLFVISFCFFSPIVIGTSFSQLVIFTCFPFISFRFNTLSVCTFFFFLKNAFSVVRCFDIIVWLNIQRDTRRIQFYESHSGRDRIFLLPNTNSH